ncbi:MAG TPA: hypothetical protein QF625_01565 [Candidatus Scalindua sp.]|nr:hypothetical protein [Candidatus Scalindua sp.]
MKNDQLNPKELCIKGEDLAWKYGDHLREKYFALSSCSSLKLIDAEFRHYSHPVFSYN